jgi:hypothetical protein
LIKFYKIGLQLFLFHFGKYKEENPGVSATSPPATEMSSTYLVVCFPLPILLLTFSGLSLQSGLSEFKRLDFPVPDGPAKTEMRPFN